MPLVAVFAIGLFVSLSRSDFGLLVFWLWLAQIYLWRRAVLSRQMAVSATVLLLVRLLV